MKRKRTQELYDIEMRLIPVLLDMKMRGIKVDVEKAKKANIELSHRIDRDQSIMDKTAGVQC